MRRRLRRRTVSSISRDFAELEAYRREYARGLLIRIPVPIGATVWRARENPACHYGVREAERFLFGKVVTPRWIAEPVPFSLRLVEEWGITVFQSEADATVLAKKKGDEQSET